MNRKQKLALFLAIAVLLTLLFYLRVPIATAFRWLGNEAYTFYSSMDVIKGSALSVAIAALIVAWNNFKRGNTAVVKLINVVTSGSQTMGVNAERPYHAFTVELKNLGIALRNVAVGITGFSEMGRGQVPLKQFQFDKPAPEGGALEKGMIAKFAIRSFEIDPAARAILTSFGDAHASDIQICVYSNGYLVKCFRLDRPTLKWRRKWNRLAHKFNGAFTTRKKLWGREFVCPHDIVPGFQDPDFYLKHFIKSIKDEASKGPE